VTVTLDQVKATPTVDTFIKRGDELMATIGYTEHSFRHAKLVSSIASNILQRLGFPARDVEMAAIAGYLHDIGNCVGRATHAQNGALISFQLLREMNMDNDEVASIVGAIGNHEEREGGQPVNNISSAVILADKSDVHRSRVRNQDPATFDIHDRVNYAAKRSFVRVDERKKLITLELEIDTKISPVMDYFEIFLSRMVMCRRAANFLGCEFELMINDVKLL